MNEPRMYPEGTELRGTGPDEYCVSPRTRGAQTSQNHGDRNIHDVLTNIINNVFNLNLKPLDPLSNSMEVKEAGEQPNWHQKGTTRQIQTVGSSTSLQRGQSLEAASSRKPSRTAPSPPTLLHVSLAPTSPSQGHVHFSCNRLRVCFPRGPRFRESRNHACLIHRVPYAQR